MTPRDTPPNGRWNLNGWTKPLLVLVPFGIAALVGGVTTQADVRHNTKDIQELEATKANAELVEEQYDRLREDVAEVKRILESIRSEME